MSGPTAPDLHPATVRLLLLAAIALTVVVRVAYLADKPFWRDEAWVAGAAQERLMAVGDAQRPRPVPIGFMAMIQAAAALPGLSPEVAYRLLPLLVGLLVPPLFGWFARALGASAATMVIVVWLAAGLPPFVYYSRELKSYGLDLFFALLVPLLAWRALADGPRAGGAAGAGLTLAVIAAPWVSFAALFPIVGALSWAWLRWWRPAATAVRRTLLIASGLFGLSFALAYQVGLGNQAASRSLHRYWATRLFTVHETSLLEQIPDAIARYAVNSTTYFFPSGWPLAIGLAALGLAVWPVRSRGFLLWLAAAPAAAAIGAALADRYLLEHGRLLLFAAPPLLLFTAAGLAWLGARAGRRGTAVAIGAAVVVALGWSAAAIRHRLPPHHNNVSLYFRYDVLHDVDAAIAAAAAVVPPDEPLLISLFAGKQFAYYSRGRLPQALVCIEPCPDFSQRRAEFLAAVGGRGWAMLIDEEVWSFNQALEAANVTRARRVRVRGVQLWELTRSPPPGS
ncbi:MAG: hypothetical protein ACRERC_03080 [Candidatus Binatia bacterium]